MRFVIKHEGRGRLRVHMVQKRMSCREADTLLYYLESLAFVEKAKVYERTQDAVICYQRGRQQVIEALQRFCYEKTRVPEDVFQNSGGAMNR